MLPGRRTITSGRDAGPVRGGTFNTWVKFASTNVEMAKVEPQYDLGGELTGVGLITIQFLNGSQYEYADRPMSDWYDLIESGSKGSFTYYEVRGDGPSHPGMGLWKPCRKIRNATRTAAEVARLAASRQPTTPKQRQRRYTAGGKRNAYARGQIVRPAVG
jgi:hypothetical protein